MPRWGKGGNQAENNRSEQVAEFFLGQTGLADERPESAFGKFTVVGHREAAHGGMAQNDVAARLMIDFVPHLAKGTDASAPEHTGSLLMRALPPLLQ